MTCVAYEMLVQKDFAWAIKTGGKLISGKPGGVQAYDISASVVRALARSMMIRRGVLLGNRLHWMWAMSLATYSGPVGRLDFFQNYSLPSAKFPGSANISLRILRPTVRTYSKFARVQLQFSADSQISASFGPKPTNTNIAYAYQGSLDIRPGRTAVLLRHLCDYDGRQWYSAVVFDVERYPYQDASTIERINSIGRYVHAGPKGLTQIAEVSAAWQHYAAGHPGKLTATDAHWTKALAGGAMVTLQAVSSGTWFFCKWSPDGRPLGRTFNLIPREKVGVQFSVRVPAWPDRNYTGRSLPGPWLGVIRGYGTPDNATCTIGLDSGKWKILATAKPSPAPRTGLPFSIPRDFSFMDHRFGVYFSIGSATHKVYISLFMAARAPDMSRRALAVGAISRDGKFVSPRPGNLSSYQYLRRFQTRPSTAIGEYRSETIQISPDQVKRYVWITRPRHWVTFRGFALQPSPLPSTVFALEQRQGSSMKMAVGTAKPAINIAANQTTPAGLMAMLGHAMRSGNPVDMERLVYAPTPAERHLLAAQADQAAAQDAYGLWEAAEARFGVAQLRRAGLGNFIGNTFTPGFPQHWKIKGTYATPLQPLPADVSWPAKGQPLHALIKRNGLWYLDFDITSAQLTTFQKAMTLSSTTLPPQTQAYQTVMQQLKAGKIKNAYALRDALNAALKHFSKPPQ